MKEQPEKTTETRGRKSRPLIVLSGFVVLVAAIALVTALTVHVVKNHQKTSVAVVSITKNGFVPATLSVKKGTEIIWTNNDTELHQVASNPFPRDNGLPGLKSQILNNGQTFEYTADKTGTFGYHDDRQPTLNATLVIQK